MEQSRRYGFSSDDRRDLWRRFREGQSLHEIARAFSKEAGSIRCVVAATGGISPAPRKRPPWALTLGEREEISRGVAAGRSVRKISAKMKRAPSTVSREVRRNGGRRAYRASDAEGRAWRRARRPKLCRLATSALLRRKVADKLSANWSPEQIAGWLKVAFAGNVTMQISHEAIYRSLFIQARGVLKKELMTHLRTKRCTRRSRKASRKGHSAGQIVDAVSIRERPPEAEDRAVPGHWEGDLLAGGHKSCIATLVERRSRYTMLVKLPNKETQSVVAALKEKGDGSHFSLTRVSRGDAARRAVQQLVRGDSRFRVSPDCCGWQMALGVSLDAGSILALSLAYGGGP